jgi:beta-lactamase class A
MAMGSDKTLVVEDCAYVYNTYMTLVMDGVRRTSVQPMPVVLRRPRPVVEPLSGGRRKVAGGMDGIRTQSQLSPRQLLSNTHGEAFAQPAFELPRVPWTMPSIGLPSIPWKRPAIAFGLIATAVAVSALGIQFHSTPRATANARVASAPAPTRTSSAAVVVAPKKVALQQLVNNFVAGNASEFSIVVTNLKTGETASYNPNRQLESASLYKLFVAKGIYEQIDLGKLSYDDPAGGGSGRNISQCLTIMINISDNTCGRALGAILGWGDQNQALTAEGYGQTNLATPQQTSAADVATLFTRLYDGTLLSPASTQNFMGLLKDQQVNNRLPQGLPAGTVVAHKTGDLDGFVHDAGIVYGSKSNYLVVVTSGPWNEPGYVPAMFANLSQQLWNYFEQ